MTTPMRNGVACPECGTSVATQTAFSDWLRSLPFPLDSKRISNHNLDYIWHNYPDGWFITIEEKCYGGESSFAQRDTHGLVAQLLKVASGAECLTARGQRRRIDYRGHYVIRFECTTPDDGWMEINGERSTRDDLVVLLTYGRTTRLEVAA